MRNTILAFVVLAAPLAAQETKGSLVIVGGGRIPDEVRKKFVELAGGKEAKIVVVPTASENADKPEEHEKYLKDWKALKPASVQLLHTRDRKVADSEEFVKPLAEATGVWFSGGAQSRITEAYLDTRAEKEFRKVLERGGVVGGTSAGAAIMSDPMITGGNPEAKTGRGFGFLPGIIVDQHFHARKRQDRLKGVLEKFPRLAGLGIDEGTAAVVKDGKIEILGDSMATLYTRIKEREPLVEKVLRTKEMIPLTAIPAK